jgi:hypothetical protein
MMVLWAQSFPIAIAFSSHRPPASWSNININITGHFILTQKSHRKLKLGPKNISKNLTETGQFFLLENNHMSCVGKMTFGQF